VAQSSVVRYVLTLMVYAELQLVAVICAGIIPRRMMGTNAQLVKPVVVAPAFMSRLARPDMVVLVHIIGATGMVHVRHHLELIALIKIPGVTHAIAAAQHASSAGSMPTARATTQVARGQAASHARAVGTGIRHRFIS